MADRIVDLSDEQARAVKTAFEMRVTVLLDLGSGDNEAFARAAYDQALILTSASRALGLGHGDLPTFEEFRKDANDKSTAPRRL